MICKPLACSLLFDFLLILFFFSPLSAQVCALAPITADMHTPACTFRLPYALQPDTRFQPSPVLQTPFFHSTKEAKVVKCCLNQWFSTKGSAPPQEVHKIIKRIENTSATTSAIFPFFIEKYWIVLPLQTF